MKLLPAVFIFLSSITSFGQSEFNGQDFENRKPYLMQEALSISGPVRKIMLSKRSDLDTLIAHKKKFKLVNILVFLTPESFRLSQELFDAFEIKSVVIPDARHLDLEQTIKTLSYEESLVVLRIANAKQIPGNIGLLKNLVELSFSGSRTRKIPASLFTLPLATLDLSGNKNLGKSKALHENAFNVENLSLAACGIRVFPSKVLCSSKLSVLSLYENKMKTLPEKPCVPPENSNLTALYVDLNPIEVIPESFFDSMNELRYMWCGRLSRLDPGAKSELRKAMEEHHPMITFWLMD